MKNFLKNPEWAIAMALIAGIVFFPDHWPMPVLAAQYGAFEMAQNEAKPASPPDAKLEPHKLTLQECQNVRQGLRMLDGYTGLDKDGKSAPVQYKLGALRGPIALDAMDLDAKIKAGDEARVKLVKENLPDGVPQPGTKEYADFIAHDPNYKKFIDAYQKILDAPQDIEIPHIKIDQLHIGDPPDGNPIPSDVLTLLAPILER